MTLVHWTPGRSRQLTARHDEIDRLFDRLVNGHPFGPLAPLTGAIVPPVDVEETKDGYVFRVDLPGVDPKDVKVRLEADTLTLSGERKRQSDTTDGDVHRTERAFGAFERSFTLPAAVRGDQVKASYANGVLEIQVPKAEEARAREIEVKVG